MQLASEDGFCALIRLCHVKQLPDGFKVSKLCFLPYPLPSRARNGFSLCKVGSSASDAGVSHCVDNFPFYTKQYISLLLYWLPFLDITV
jgi:hypothetical protein